MREEYSLKSILKNYTRKDFFSDLFAGLTVAVMMVPQGMAYAMLAGLPPIYGLYAGFIPLFIFPFISSSKHVSIGPVALVAIILLAGLSPIAEPLSDEFISLAILVSFIAGLMQIIFAFFKLGALVSFLSRPVILGFTAGAAIIICVSQIKSILGLDIPRANNLIEDVQNTFSNLDQANLATMLIGIGCIVFLLICRKISKYIPAALIAVILFCVLVVYKELDVDGVAIIGDIPSGLPAFTLPAFNFENIRPLLTVSFLVTIISIISSMAISKTISAKNGNYVINSTRELFALGLSKLVGSFFLAFPATASFARSAINDDLNAKSGISSFVTAISLGLILLFFTSWFYYLPKAVLGAIVVVAVIKFIDIKQIKKLFKIDRKDFYVFLVTFLVTLSFGIITGVVAGIVLSIGIILLKTSRPHYAVLGRVPGVDSFRNIARYEQAIEVERTLIFRFDESLFFGNTDYFIEKLNEEIFKRNDLENVILDVSSIADIDSTALKMVEITIYDLKKRNITLKLCNAVGPLRDILHQSGLMEQIGFQNQFVDIEDALIDKDDFDRSHQIATQTNN